MTLLSPQLLTDSLAIARQAGEHLQRFYQRFELAAESKSAVQNALEIHIKADDTPVTEADLFISQFLTEKLTALTPNIPILSEENCAIPFAERRQWQHYWLIDPLDGTQQFINRTDQFSILITLMEANRPVLAIIHAPILGKTYYAMKGFGAHKIDQEKHSKIQPHFFHADRPLKIAIGATSKRDKVRSILPENFPHEFVIYGSSGLKGAMVAEGLADCYVRLGNTGEWDTAAAELLLTETGGRVFDSRHQPLTYNQRESLANPHFVMVADGQVDWQKIFQFNKS